MLENLKAKAAIWWSFIGEAILAAFVVLLLTAVVGEESITRFVERFTAGFLGLPALLVALSLQLRSTVSGAVSGDFAGWLQHKGSDLYYLVSALLTVWCGVAVFLICTILAAARTPFWATTILGFLILSILQAIDLSRTRLEIHKLRTTFEREKKKEELKDKDSE
jgi:hypothetical protein